MNEPSKSISVLIPNYDWDVVELVKALHDQLSKAKIEFEILCFDDSAQSDHHKRNLELDSLDGVTYRINKQPLGRANNRNALAETSQFNYLLFLDGDAGLAQNSRFIEEYLKHISPNLIVCGGTAYDATPPKDGNLLLRYVYGKKREEKSAAYRQQEPWKGFSAFNFVIPRAVFMNIMFDRSMSKYGHEDTLFGNELKYRCIPIKHLDNQVLHLGLDETAEFILKTRTGIDNLRDLIDAGLIDEDVKLYAWYSRVRKAASAGILGGLFNQFHNSLEKQLCGPNPSITLFDIYKLAYLCSLPVNHRKPPVRKI